MPKTEVILTHSIVGLGAESDQVKVAAGYARNYLFPQRLAVPVTGANKRRLEVLRQRRAEREAHEFNTMSELAKSISKLTCVVKVKTGDDGKMFGTVTSGAIADELKHQFEITLDKKKIHLEHPIRTLGEHDVELRLHPEVNSSLKVRVESTTPPPQAPAAPAGRGKESARARDEKTRGKEGAPPITEKRGRRPEAGPRLESKHEAPRPAKGEKPVRADKGDKSEKAEKADKGKPA